VTVTSPPDLREALQRLFGFAAFREGQEEVVRRAVEGRDTLALMPTGAGKSLCYQLSAMLRPTPTLIVSPLIALMKDQLDNLPPEVARRSSFINSSLDPVEAARRLTGLAAGEYSLIYAAPERLRQRAFVSALSSVGVGLVVIDEVHCVSMWGHDFRPDYMFIRKALDALGGPAVLGVTATATRDTERDISLGLGRNLEAVRASVVRPNLRYEVEPVENEEGRLRVTLARARELGGSGIIYARAREKCEQLAALLQRNGVHALHYHARLEPGERARVQERFIRGEARVIVATTAFGMGIDKADIRWVLLYNFPNSLESYVQMVGRAGRDGQHSDCVLLASKTDASNLRRFAKADLPTVDGLRGVYKGLRARAEDGRAQVEPDELSDAARLPEDADARVYVGMLERAGLLARDFDAGRAMRVELALPPPADAAGRIAELLDGYEARAGERADRMIAFAEARRCRHLQVARHFGESVRTPCGMCDVCAPSARAAIAAPEAPPLPDDLTASILDAVEGLRWPLSQKGLVSMLKGSPAASRSAQANPAYGALAAASESAIRGWVKRLTDAGCIEAFESEDGYRLLRIGDRAGAPRIAASSPAPSKAPLSGPDGELFERLRAWRHAKAQEQEAPAYTVLPDRALRELAASRPADEAELSTVHGIGPAKLERYGEELLRLVREPDAPAPPDA
jgi:ATP-dependent DNA helicase RecQ